jgi:hypothetical protein
MRYYSKARLNIVMVLAAIVSLLLTTSCRPGSSDGGGIPKVTVSPGPSVSSSPTTTSSASVPAPSLPTSPSCGLLKTDEVREALGGGVVQQPFGNLFKQTNGFAGVLVDMDMCSWQQNAGTDPGRSVQIQVITAQSMSDANKEYDAAVSQLVEHYPSGSRPVSVPGIGTRAARIPEWLVAQNAKVVITVSVSKTVSGAAPDSSVLESLARTVASRLGW